MSVLTKENLINIREYKHASSPEETPMERFLNPYVWEPMSRLIPDFIAPNVITLFGTVMAICTIILLLYYDMSLSKELPSWLYLILGLSLFSFVNIDNLDGKQARRMKCCTPLGNVFDHCSDAIGCFCWGLLVSQLFQFGPSYAGQIMSFSMMWGHLLIFWEEKQTGAIKWSEGNLGYTEGFYLLGSALLLASYFGIGFLNYDLLVLFPSTYVPTGWTFPCKYLYLYVGGFGLLNVIAHKLCNTFWKSKDKLESLKGILPMIFLQIMTSLWLLAPIALEYAALIHLIFGAVYVNLSHKCIISAMIKVNYPIIQPIYLFMLLGLIPAYLCCYKYFTGDMETICESENQKFLIFGIWILTSTYTFVFIYRVISLMADFMNIKCFVISNTADNKSD